MTIHFALVVIVPPVSMNPENGQLRSLAWHTHKLWIEMPKKIFIATGRRSESCQLYLEERTKVSNPLPQPKPLPRAHFVILGRKTSSIADESQKHSLSRRLLVHMPHRSLGIAVVYVLCRMDDGM